MNRTFCDVCAAEITDNNRPSGGQGGNPVSDWRLGGEWRGIRFEVIVGNKEASNKGDFCKYCIITAVQSLDDRPRTA